MAEPEIKLKVGELTNRSEVGRGIVRMDMNSMKNLNIREGDIVELEGQRKSPAIAVRAYPADVGLNIIRMDGLLRMNASIGLGESAKVRKAEAKEAKKVVLAPAQKGILLTVSPNLLRQNLIMRPLLKGDIISPSPVYRKKTNTAFEDFFGVDVEDFFFGLPIGFPADVKLMVVKTNPDDIVKVTDITEIEILPEAVEIEERKIPAVTYEDIGGLNAPIQKIREMVELPLRHPELFERLGIEPPKGVMLYGPPGTGKTLLARAVANESGAYFLSISGPEIMSKWYGQSEENLRKFFEDAEKNAPSIIFIDEVDAIAPKREEVTGEVERRVVAQLLSLMDGMRKRGRVVVIAATNRENSIDPALRRPGRFDREIEIGVPDRTGRREILQIHMRNMPLDKTVEMDRMADITHGFVGADLEALCKEAAMSVLRRVIPDIKWKEETELPREVLEKLIVSKSDFENALRIVEPSAMREVLVEIPNVTWDDIGGLEEVKYHLKEVIEWPLKYADSFDRMGIEPPRGVLLYGPPGCGKTLLAKAIAHEAGVNFISIKGPELISKWVGESERAVRDIFRRARQVAPSIIFFDEVDAIAPRRGSGDGSHVMEQVVSQLLTEMSGLEKLENVVVIAATNRPDMLDPALLRPGRFDRQVIVPGPDEKSRLKIFEVHTKSMPLAKNVSIDKLAKETEGYSGADIEALCREAAIGALRKDMKAKEVDMKNFNDMLKVIKPSLTPELMKAYQQVFERMKKSEKKDELQEQFSYVG